VITKYVYLENNFFGFSFWFLVFSCLFFFCCLVFFVVLVVNGILGYHSKQKKNTQIPNKITKHRKYQKTLKTKKKKTTKLKKTFSYLIQI
jgi:lipopolysaccharide export LptBFGC system permease protein LptF